ncbi:MAG: hypothetical protein WC881_04340 [Elusimicrobiota bacterium]|jgi:hypothetical protein
MAAIPSNYGAAVVIYGGGWHLIELGHLIRNAYDRPQERRLRRKNYGI